MSLFVKEVASAPPQGFLVRFKLQQVYLLLTRQCNLTCTHCIRSSSPLQKEMMDKSLALRVLDSLHFHGSEAILMISGGEPTLHPDFGEIVAAGLARFRQVVVNTNGLRLSPLVSACQHPAASIQVSVDGDETAHDQMRGHGSFKRTIANIQQLAEMNIPVTIATTVTKWNINTISSLDQALAGINFARWNVKRIVGSGRAMDADDMPTHEWNSFVTCLRQTTLNTERLRISSMFSEAGIRAASKRSYALDESQLIYANCGTGRSKLYVNPDGTVYPCACMEGRIVGGFADNSADEILQKLDGLEIEPVGSSVCRSCPVWQHCHGGCPGAAMRTDSPSLGDPRCPLAAAGRIDAGYSCEA